MRAILATALLCALSISAHALEAFPGAEGYGKLSQGGRSGAIIYVTNLNDTGTGSLRACIEASDARNCVFRVGGTIKTQRPLTIRNGRISILGQTAPGGGIRIRYPGTTSGATLGQAMQTSGASDVLVRNISIRLRWPDGTKIANAFIPVNGARIYLDHVSGSWAPDQNVSTYRDATDVTIAYGIWGEGLARHSKCFLAGDDMTKPQNISFWRNLCISNNDRNPNFNQPGGSCLEVTDNLFYNANSEWSETFSQWPGGTPISHINNYMKGGPMTNSTTYAIAFHDNGMVAPPKIYHTGTVTWPRPGTRIILLGPGVSQYVVSQPPCTPSAPTIGSAEAAYDEVRAKAGAWPRDEVDKRYINEVGARGVAGTGPAQLVSALPAMPGITGGTPYVDGDQDGMADSQEAQFGANPWADDDGDGWPNFDEFMQWLFEERMAGRYPQ